MKRAQCIALLAAGAIVAACAPTVEYRHLGIDPLRNDQGHVIGHKETLADPKTGEQFEQVTHYEPMLDANGAVVAYKEPTRGGAVIRSLDGRRIGARYSDLRSRSTNPGNEGITITISP